MPAGWCHERAPRPGRRRDRRRPRSRGRLGAPQVVDLRAQVGLRAGHLRRRLVASTGGLDVCRVEVAPELVDRLGRLAGHHGGQDGAQLVADRVPDPVELGVGDVDQAGEPRVGPVLRLEVHGYADRPTRQVAVQATGDQPGVTTPVGLEELDRVVHVRDEAAEADAVVAVPVRRRTVGNVLRRDVDVGDLGVRRGLVRCVREDGADGRGHASGEERRDVDGEQHVDGRPVTAADRGVLAEVLDRVVGEQVPLAAVEGDEQRQQVRVEREAVARVEDRVHEPAEGKGPGVRRDLRELRGVAVHGEQLHLRLDVVQLSFRPDAALQLVHQVDEVLRSGELELLVAREVSQGGDALDVVADVGRGAGPARVAVVHDRERHRVVGDRRGGAVVGRLGDPGPQPVAVHDEVAARPLALLDRAVEGLEQGAGQVEVAVREHRPEHREPSGGSDVRRLGSHQLPDRCQRRLRVEGQPGADVLLGGVRRPQLDRESRQLLPGEHREATAEGDDPRREGTDVSCLRLAGQGVGHGDRHRCPPLRHVLADLGDDRLGQRTTATKDLDGSPARWRRTLAGLPGVCRQPSAGGRARRAGRPSA